MKGKPSEVKLETEEVEDERYMVIQRGPFRLLRDGVEGLRKKCEQAEWSQREIAKYAVYIKKNGAKMEGRAHK